MARSKRGMLKVLKQADGLQFFSGNQATL